MSLVFAQLCLVVFVIMRRHQTSQWLCDSYYSFVMLDSAMNMLKRKNYSKVYILTIT